MFLLRRPRAGTSAQRIEHVVRWPFGVAGVLWQRLPGGPPVHRTETYGDGGDLPLPVPVAHRDARVQFVADGVGDLLHRRYTVVVDGAELGPREVVARFAEKPNCVVPAMAVFQKTRGGPGPMRPGDEFAVRMPAPWDGPVRVIDLSPTAVRFATLRGHLEAGQIEFRAGVDTDGALVFEIESWARPGDRMSDLLYNYLPVAKEIQLTLWVQTCTGVAALAGGTPRDGVSVETRRVPCGRLESGRSVQPPPGV